MLIDSIKDLSINYTNYISLLKLLNPVTSNPYLQERIQIILNKVMSNLHLVLQSQEKKLLSVLYDKTAINYDETVDIVSFLRNKKYP